MQVPGANTKDYGVGLAMDTYRGLRTVAHGGALGGYRAEMLRFPDDKFTVICLCNHGGADAPGLARKIAGFYLGDKMKPGIAAPGKNGSAGPLADLEGLFVSAEVPAEWRMVSEKGKLTLKRRLRWSIPLDESGPGEFQVGPWKLVFERDAHGAVSGFRLDSGRIRGIQFLKR